MGDLRDTTTTDAAQNQSPLNLQQIESIERMGTAELDQLPMGAIRLDSKGTILSFNKREAVLTGRDPAKVIGRNFFTEVAPCTNVQTFAGKFREGVSKGDLHTVFPYRFDFEMTPRDVTVTLFYSKQTGSAWVFVREGK
ncbi:MAG TPA: PAS domain-containing protein [Thermoanaerobaculia bacterium]|nr:PAS domain-containing protein [Thermoanaerobaculia bacterium]